MTETPLEHARRHIKQLTRLLNEHPNNSAAVYWAQYLNKYKKIEMNEMKRGAER